MPKVAMDPADYILSLDMNGLSGRMLRLPPPANRRHEVMFVYGHHASLERWFGVAEYINKYAGVTIPDLPGFGGMDAFYKIGEKPSLDNLADYLASFIKFRYRKQKFTIIGLSLGFMIVTRMLQKYPELAKQVEVVCSFAGFTNKKDFKFHRTTYWFFRGGTYFFSFRLPAAFVKYVVMRGPFIRWGYRFIEPMAIKSQDSKMTGADKQERQKRINFEVQLWQCNNLRTYMAVAHTMFTLDLRGKHVGATVEHLAIEHDRYFDNLSVEQHMRQIYEDFHLLTSKVPGHTPTVIATAEDAVAYVRPFTKILNKMR